MNHPQDPVPPILHQLWNLSAQIQHTGDYLPPHRELLGDEHITYVRDAAVGMLQKLQAMMQHCVALATTGQPVTNPLENKDERHDMRNQIAVVRGFSDLMLMDVPHGHQAGAILVHLRDLADHYCQVLDQIKAHEPGVSVFAG